jgi:hypothetical protein
MVWSTFSMCIIIIFKALDRAIGFEACLRPRVSECQGLFIELLVKIIFCLRSNFNLKSLSVTNLQHLQLHTRSKIICNKGGGNSIFLLQNTSTITCWRSCSTTSINKSWECFEKLMNSSFLWINAFFLKSSFSC